MFNPIYPDTSRNKGSSALPLSREAWSDIFWPPLRDHWTGARLHVLIDTGAASTVVSLTLVQSLELKMVKMPTLGGGAGGANLEIYHVPDATLMIGDVKPKTQALFAMDLSHVNQALAIKGEGPVDVILGVDVFEAQSAVIDYGSSSLYLKD